MLSFVVEVLPQALRKSVFNIYSENRLDSIARITTFVES